MAPRPTLEERFWANVDRRGPTECWPWKASTTSEGRYGVTYAWGKRRPAHRVAYLLAVGPIPEGFDIDHVRDRGCTSTLCCNPAHLEPVTHRENVLRGRSKQAENARKTHCPRGHPYDMTTTSGGRWCSICHRKATREAQRRYRARKKAQRERGKPA